MEYQHQLQFFQQPQHSSGQFQQQHQAASFYLSTPQPHQVNSNFSGQGPPVNQNQQHMQYSQGQSAQPTGTNTHYSLQSQHEQRSQFLPYGLTSNSVVSNSYAQPPGTSMPYAFNNVQGYFGPPTPLPYGHGPLMPQQPQPMGRNPPNNSIRRGGEANSSSNRSAATNKHNNGNNSSKAEDTSSKNYQNLFVTKIPRDVTDGSLLTIFKPYGALSAKVMVDAATGYSKGFGFVVFPSEQQGKWVHEQFNKRPITVSEETVLAVPPGDRPPRHVYEFTMFPSHHDSGSAAKESTSLYIRNVPRGWDVARVVELLRLYGDPIYYAMRDDRLGNPVWVVYVEYDCLTCSRNALKHIHGLRTGLGQPPILAKFADNAEVRKFRRDKRMSAQQTNKSPQMGGGGGARQERDDDVVNSHEGELTNEGRVSRHHHHHSALTPTGEEEKEEGEGNGVTRSETNKPNVVVEPTAEANKDAGAEAEAKALLAHSVVQPNNNAPANSESESEKATPSTPHGVESNVGHGNKVESPEEGDAQLPSEINGPHIPDDRHAADAKSRHSMTMPSAGDSVSCMKLGNKKSSQSAASNSKREHPVPLSHFFDSHIAFDAQGNPLPHILEEAASVRVEAALAAAQGAPTAATVPATTVPVHLPSLATPPVNVLAPAGFAVPSSAQFSSPSHVVSVTNFSDMDKDSGGQQQRAPPSYSTSTYPMTSHCQGHAHQFGAPTSGQQEFVGFDGARLGVLPTTAASYPTNPQGVIFGAHQHHHHQQQQVYHVTQRDPVPMVNPNVPSAYASTAMGGGIFVNNAGGGAQTSNFYDNNGYGHNTTNNNYSSAASSMGSHVGSSLGGAATASSQGIAYGGAMMNGMVTSGASGHHFGALTSLQTSSSPIASSTLSQHQRQQQQEVYFPAHLASAAAALVAGGRGGAGGHYGSAVAGPQGGPMLTSAAILNNNSNSDANNGVIYNNQNINGSNTNSNPNNMAGMGHGSGFGPLFVRGEGDISGVHSSNGSASSNSQTRGNVGDRTVAASLSLAVSSTGVSYPSSSAPVGLVSFQQHQQQHGVYVMALQQLNNTANNNNNNNNMSIHSQQQQQQQHYQPSSTLAYHQSSSHPNPSFAHNPNPPPPHLNEGGVFLQQQQQQQQHQQFSAPVEAMSASDSSTTSHNVITQYNAGRRLEGGGGGVAADDGSVANFSSSLVGTAGTVGSSGEQLGTANSFVSGFGGNAAATAVTAVSAAPLSPSTGADSAAGADDENKHAHHSPIDMAQW